MNFLRIYESIDDFEAIERAAWKIAKRKHDDTKAIRRNSGKPYFIHPERVAKLLKDLGAPRVEIIAGLLHDLIEDAGATYEDMIEKFGQDIANIVVELTNDNQAIKAAGKEKYMSQKMIGLSNPALDVKLADVCDNMGDSPGPKQRLRMLQNLNDLITTREPNDIQAKLLDIAFERAEK
jgi:(p)ppGpp synthase/HD superfamily hydrolase